MTKKKIFKKIAKLTIAVDKAKGLTEIAVIREKISIYLDILDVKKRIND